MPATPRAPRARPPTRLVIPRVFTRLAVLATVAALMAVLGPASTVKAQPTGPAPPTNLVASDHPWDDGKTVDLKWDLSPDGVQGYSIERAPSPDGPWTLVENVDAGTFKFRVKPVERDALNYFRVVALTADGIRSTPADSEGVVATMQIFDGSRAWLFLISFIFCGAVVFWINHARKGRPIKVRPIAGLEAVDEAVGRATEMGRSVLFVPGIQDINEIQTIAAMTVLAHVAKTAAEYDAKVEVPTSKSLVMTTARETVQGAYLAAGRPDAYNEDLIYYVTDEQFGYVAYLQGMMVREKPAACFYMGAFFAESLILAETGNSIGAIQIAGTAMPAQLPFFVAACDYTLIGEEFFAASAYLSGSPEELGSLKGQDVGKLIVGALLIFGVVIATLASILDSPRLANVVTYLKEVILT